jgi:hypothetical protein
MTLARHTIQATDQRIYRWMEKLSDLYVKIRSPAYNKIGWVAVFFGVFIAAGSFWTNVLASILGAILETRVPDIYLKVKAILDQYVQLPDNISVICGTIIAICGLLYHLAAATFLQVQNVAAFNKEVDLLNQHLEADLQTIREFSDRYPDQEFREALAYVTEKNRMDGSMRVINKRHDYWRSSAVTFFSAELRERQKDLCKAHELVKATFREWATRGEIAKQQFDDALGKLNQSSILTSKAIDVYEAKALELKKARRIR